MAAYAGSLYPSGSFAAQDTTPTSGLHHPPSFYCPISQQCMHDPVVLSDGHSYERRYIERWLSEHDTSPVTREHLSQRCLFPNHALRNAIEEYFEQVFSTHRRAIRKTICGLEGDEGFGSNAQLLRTIDGLMQCSLLMSSDLSSECVLQHIMDEARTLVGAEVASVFLVDEARQELYSTVNSTDTEIRIPITAGIAGHVATSGQPVVIEDVYSDSRFNRSMDQKTGFRTRSMMCAPLKVKKHGVIGVVQLINKASPGVLGGRNHEDRFGMMAAASESFSADDLQFMQVFASQAATAIVNSGTLNEPLRQEAAKIPRSPTAASEAPSPRKIPSGSLSGKAQEPCKECCCPDADTDAGAKEAQSCTLDEDKGSGVSAKRAEHSEACSGRKRSGRARQRAAKFWASARCRTPSPSSQF